MTRILLLVAGALHFLFMLGEFFPWHSPILFQWLSMDLSWSNVAEKHFVISVVHNAAIYNGIVSAGLFFAACAGAGTTAHGTPRTMAYAAAPSMAHDATRMATVLLVGAAIAGVFGAITLGWLVIFQAVIVGLVLVGLWKVALLKIVAQWLPPAKVRP